MCPLSEQKVNLEVHMHICCQVSGQIKAIQCSGILHHYHSNHVLHCNNYIWHVALCVNAVGMKYAF